jgi:hypothetical protein
MGSRSLIRCCESFVAFVLALPMSALINAVQKAEVISSGDLGAWQAVNKVIKQKSPAVKAGLLIFDKE